MNISNNISSIQSNQNMMNLSAQRVANINGDESKTGQVDLAKEFTNQMLIQDSTSANISTIKTQNEMLGSLLDIKA